MLHHSSVTGVSLISCVNHTIVVSERLGTVDSWIASNFRVTEFDMRHASQHFVAISRHVRCISSLPILRFPVRPAGAQVAPRSCPRSCNFSVSRCTKLIPIFFISSCRFYTPYTLGICVHFFCSCFSIGWRNQSHGDPAGGNTSAPLLVAAGRGRP